MLRLTPVGDLVMANLDGKITFDMDVKSTNFFTLD